MSWLQSAIRLFLPEEGRFFGYLEDTAASADRAAKLFSELAIAKGRDSQLVLVERIREAEHDGDRAMRIMADALDATFVTPIDREDLYHLNSSLEAVSDFISATSNHLTVHKMDTLPEGTKELADVLVRSTARFSEAIGLLKTRNHAETIRNCCDELRALEHEADVIFRIRLGELFEREKDAIVLIKHKEFLEGLENAVDRCADVGTLIEAILIKNG